MTLRHVLHTLSDGTIGEVKNNLEFYRTQSGQNCTLPTMTFPQDAGSSSRFALTLSYNILSKL